MKQKIINSLALIKQTLFDDILDRYLFLAGILIYFVDLILWQSFFKNGSSFVFLRISIYPISYLGIVLLVNTFLSISSHDREREVGYLLLMGNIIVALLCLALEIFYLAHMP